MRVIVAKQIVGYLAMTVTIVAIGLPLHLLIEWATGKKLVFVQSFLVYFVGVLFGMIVRQQTVRLFAKTEVQKVHHRKSTREKKIERLLETNWVDFLLIAVCAVIAGVVIALLSWSFDV